MRNLIVAVLVLIFASAGSRAERGGWSVRYNSDDELPMTKWTLADVTVSSTGYTIFLGTNTRIFSVSVNSTHSAMGIGLSTAAQTAGGLPVYFASMTVAALEVIAVSSSAVSPRDRGFSLSLYNSEKTLTWRGGLNGWHWPGGVRIWAYVGEGATDTYELDAYEVNYNTHGSTVVSRGQ